MSEEKDYFFTGYNHKMLEQVRSLRKAMTSQERRLWYEYLRTYPIKFYRQRSIDRFVVDFYCPAAKLIIELDGAKHYTQEGKTYDRLRTEILNRYNLQVLRFSDSEIDHYFSQVCGRIDREIRRLTNMDAGRD